MIGKMYLIFYEKYNGALWAAAPQVCRWVRPCLNHPSRGIHLIWQSVLLSGLLSRRINSLWYFFPPFLVHCSFSEKEIKKKFDTDSVGVIVKWFSNLTGSHKAFDPWMMLRLRKKTWESEVPNEGEIIHVI